MDDLVMRRMRITLIFCLMSVSVATAQGLPDPTRPPAGVMAVPGDSLTPSSSATSPTPGPQLQSVILRQGAKPRALINGEWLEVGQSLGESKIVKIAADRVEIKGAQGRQMLKLTPEVDKLMPNQRNGIQRQEKTK